jgi:hypothetical protein
MERLKTDHVDLVQVHAVSAWADLEQALDKGGALEALEEARSEGLISYIGITGHARPALLALALREYDFDSVLIALSVVDHLVSGADLVFLPEARSRNTAVIAMKTLLHGHAPNMDRSLRYALALDGVSLAIVGMKTKDEIDTAIEIARNFKPLSEKEYEQLVEEVESVIRHDWRTGQTDSPLFWLHDISVTGWEEESEPMMVTY